jgi:two-component system OmpR family sensor kinase
MAYSLRGRLLWLLLIAVGLTALLQGAFAYYAAGREADQIFDYHMEQIALALRGHVPAAHARRVEPDVDEANFDFVIQVWGADGTRLFDSDKRESLQRQPTPGFSEVTAHGTRYRVFSVRTPTQVIQVAQDIAARQELAASLVLRMVGPVMLLAPLLMLAVWWVVTQSTRPLSRTREQIAHRAADELSPLTAPGLPDEVRPLVDEINLLFARLAEAFASQRNFVADAAHELRSPLAALRLQVQGMQRADDAESKAVAARRLLSGIDRLGRLVDQMLMLAGQDAAGATAASASIDLRSTATLAISDVLPAARERGVDLGIVDATPVTVSGDAEALRILFRNLLENAIKHGPEDGTVDVTIGERQGHATVEIADSGPGIPVEERDRAFDRFYRAPGGSAVGSGLGLAIAQSIARRHHATITLATSSRLGGLRVIVRFPAAPARTPGGGTEPSPRRPGAAYQSRSSSPFSDPFSDS